MWSAALGYPSKFFFWFILKVPLNRKYIEKIF
jgi:hypothetical protein